MSVPLWEVLRRAYDKREMWRLANDIGIAQPWTRVVTGSEDLAALRCPFPAILKPAVKETSNALTDAKAWRVEDQPGLVRSHLEACRLVDPEALMIQEFVPGGGTHQLSVAALCPEGRVARNSPPAGNGSIRSTSVARAAWW